LSLGVLALWTGCLGPCPEVWWFPNFQNCSIKRTPGRTPVYAVISALRRCALAGRRNAKAYSFISMSLYGSLHQVMMLTSADVPRWRRQMHGRRATMQGQSSAVVARRHWYLNRTPTIVRFWDCAQGGKTIYLVTMTGRCFFLSPCWYRPRIWNRLTQGRGGVEQVGGMRTHPLPSACFAGRLLPPDEMSVLSLAAMVKSGPGKHA
jgi:hypothetical protein